MGEDNHRSGADVHSGEVAPFPGRLFREVRRTGRLEGSDGHQNHDKNQSETAKRSNFKLEGELDWQKLTTNDHI